MSSRGFKANHGWRSDYSPSVPVLAHFCRSTCVDVSEERTSPGFPWVIRRIGQVRRLSLDPIPESLQVFGRGMKVPGRGGEPPHVCRHHSELERGGYGLVLHAPGMP